MKKSLFKAMVPTIAMLLVALMSLTGVTYAWFTAGDKATVETFELNVKKVDGVLISLNGYNGTWGSYVDPSSVINSQISGAPLRDVSSNGTIATVGTGAEERKVLQFYSAEYNDVFDSIVGTADVAGKQKDDDGKYSHYVAFDLYIKNDGDTAKEINLLGSEVTGTALSRAATRVAFVDMGNASSIAVINDETSPVVSGTPTLLKIWEPNDSEHSPDGVAWLTKNGQSANTTAKATYKAVDGVVTKDDGTYFTTADGQQYVEYKAAALTESNINATDPTYFVFVTGEGFKALDVNAFYQVATYTEVLANKTNYYKLVNGNYVQLVAADEVEQGTTYYKKVQVGGSGAIVKAYTKGDDAVLTSSNMTTYGLGDGNDPEVYISIAANTIKKVTIYVWVEGQDADCTNYVAGNPFAVSLELHAVTIPNP